MIPSPEDIKAFSQEVINLNYWTPSGKHMSLMVWNSHLNFDLFLLVVLLSKIADCRAVVIVLMKESGFIAFYWS